MIAQMPATARLRWARDSVRVSHMVVHNPGTWAVICFLPVCSLARRLDEKRSWDLNPAILIKDEPHTCLADLVSPAHSMNIIVLST